MTEQMFVELQYLKNWTFVLSSQILIAHWINSWHTFSFCCIAIIFIYSLHVRPKIHCALQQKTICGGRCWLNCVGYMRGGWGCSTPCEMHTHAPWPRHNMPLAHSLCELVQIFAARELTSPWVQYKNILKATGRPLRGARALAPTHTLIYIDVYTVRQVHAALPFEGWAGRPACSSVCARGWEQKRRSRTAPTTLRHYRSLRSNHWVRRDVYKCFSALNLYLENAALLSEFKSEF